MTYDLCYKHWLSRLVCLITIDKMQSGQNVSSELSVIHSDRVTVKGNIVSPGV